MSARVPINNIFDDGFESVAHFISETDAHGIITELEHNQGLANHHGIRHAEKKLATVAQYIANSHCLAMATQYLGATASLVRAIVFNKTATTNWLVAPHQDKTVSLSAPIDDPDWGPWSTKDHQLHVQPPLHVLQQMITFRIHLDAATEDNGCLAVYPGTHQQGIMSTRDIADYTATHTPLLCPAPRYCALVMRPHVLHCSSKAKKPSQRRVLHLEFCAYSLPEGVQWQ